MLNKHTSALVAYVATAMVQMLSDYGSINNGTNSLEPSAVVLRHATTILSNVAETVPGRTVMLAATPDILISLVELLKNDSPQGTEERLRLLHLRP